MGAVQFEKVVVDLVHMPVFSLSVLFQVVIKPYRNHKGRSLLGTSS